jgi:site-specific DNA-methyltransferase (adenine-specific)
VKESNDILAMFEVLSNHEVFTPPRVARQMLDLLPEEVWSHPEYRFLDPATKSGIFLREIFYRLFEGLKGKGTYLGHDGLSYDLNDPRQRTNHILKNMVFGIATSELTAYLARRTLYGVMKADSSKRNAGLESLEKSYGKDAIPDDVLARFFQEDAASERGRDAVVFNDYYDPQIFSSSEYQGFEDEGNIFYPTEEVRTIVMEEGDYEVEESYFPFIEERTAHLKILAIKGAKMKFDVIIGNPPYQLDTGGSGRQAKPIYQLFVDQAKKLKPRYQSMIIPARWYSGGFGLDKFRSEMLSDRRISKLVDYENTSDVFPGVDIAGGVCYFLWDRDYDGDCEVTSISQNQSFATNRKLNEYEIFIRQSKAIPIIRKVQGKHDSGKFLDTVISSIRPFGLPTNYASKESGIPCHFIQKIGLKFANRGDVKDSSGLIEKWKLLIPKAPIAGQTDFGKPVRFYHDKNAIVAKPGECCTESWIVACAFDTEAEVLSFRSYLFTKTVRFLILQTVISQDVNRKNFRFVPDLGVYRKEFTDDILIDMWGITKEEWSYIDSRISVAK